MKENFIEEFNENSKEISDNSVNVEHPININFDSIFWKDFDVSFNSYFNGDDNYSAYEYEQILKFVNSKCNESGEYFIDCYENRYTVRKKSEIIERVNSMLTSEQKVKNKRAERDQLLQSTDIYMLSDYPITTEEKELYKQYREYLRDIPESEEFPNVNIKTFEEWTK